jgi:hypothetical protein
MRNVRRQPVDARGENTLKLNLIFQSDTVSVSSRTSVLRWSTASVIACMGEESLLVWTCVSWWGSGVRRGSGGRETRGRKP